MATKKRSSSSGSSSTTQGLLPWLGIATIVLLLDQLTKITILKLVHYGESVPVTGFFTLVLVYNKGAAFSFLAAS
ncbi:signal peptidase II, partial [Acinetobacter baumannii]